jgi:hypothetical protein
LYTASKKRSTQRNLDEANPHFKDINAEKNASLLPLMPLPGKNVC